MRAHYGFSVRFCNPESGHEKGNVEAKIGYTRRNLFVPEPAFDDIEDYNRTLLSLHASKAQESHYKKLLPIKDLFEEDTRAFLPLPRTAFDPVRYDYLKADGYGKVRIDPVTTTRRVLSMQARKYSSQFARIRSTSWTTTNAL